MARSLSRKATNVQHFYPSQPEARDEGPRLIPLEKPQPQSSSIPTPRNRAISRHSGQVVQLTGAYKAVHSRCAERTVLLFAGARFPTCPECGSLCYSLLQAAPSAYEDPDLRPGP